MRLDEFSALQRYIAIVRVGGSQVRTSVEAESIAYAKQLLAHQFGASSVLSVMPLSAVRESGAFEPQTPSELQIKALGDQAKNLKQQQARLRAQQGLQKAEARYRKAITPKQPK